MVRIKSFAKKLFIFFFVVVVLIVLAALFLKQLFLPVSEDNKNIDFLISKGSSVSQIGNNLQKAGLIKNAIAFKFYVQVTNSQNKIQAGEFQLSPSLSMTDVLERIKKGPSEIWVTIPEGLRREEIAVKFANGLSKDSSFIVDFLNLTEGKEGYLFPDTYLFPKTATATQIVAKMTSTFDKKVTDITYQQVIMASLLERETFADSEKRLVAGVLYKRLNSNWPLQVDATLQYAKDTNVCKGKAEECEYWKPIYSNDKEIDSVFNTYKNLGLPPAPIANPGQSTLEAAINPEDSEYWYYIHDNDGRIHFAKDLSEHNANIDRYLR